MKAVVKTCPKHGELEESEVCRRIDAEGYDYINCRYCRRESNQGTYQRNREKRLAEAAKYRAENRERLAEWQRNDRKNNKEKYSQMYYSKNHYEKKLRQLVKKRGMTMEQYETMIRSQNNLCAICHCPETRKEPFDNQITRLCIDHDHVTGKTRGLLCHNCNSSLGKLKDDINILESAIRYLKKYKELDNG